MESVITGKNQVTVPASLIRALGIGPGTRLRWTLGEDGTLVAAPLPTRRALAAALLGRGRAYLAAGSDPVAELIAERTSDEEPYQP